MLSGLSVSLLYCVEVCPLYPWSPLYFLCYFSLWWCFGCCVRSWIGTNSPWPVDQMLKCLHSRLLDSSIFLRPEALSGLTGILSPSWAISSCLSDGFSLLCSVFHFPFLIIDFWALDHPSIYSSFMVVSRCPRPRHCVSAAVLCVKAWGTVLLEFTFSRERQARQLPFSGDKPPERTWLNWAPRLGAATESVPDVTCRLATIRNCFEQQ